MNYAPPELQVEQLSQLPGVVNLNRAHTGYDNVSINVVHHIVPARELDATSSLGVSQDDRQTSNPDQVGVGLAPGVKSPDQATIRSALEYRYRVRTQSVYAQEQVVTLGSRVAVTAGLTAERSALNTDFGGFNLYPKAGASYRVPQFARFLNDLKLRVAYGEAGMAPGYGFNFNNAQNFYGTFLGQVRGVVVGPNPNSNIFYQLNDTHLQPERSAELETGFDATLLDERAQLSATVYQKRVSNLTMLTPSAVDPGLAGGAVNSGSFTNRGIELSLQAWPIKRSEGLSWLAGLSFARNYSRVDALPLGPFAIAPGFGHFYGTYWAQVGRSVSEIVNVYQGASDGTPLQVGDAQPGFVMTASNTFSWRGFRLYGLVDWHRGGSAINVTNAYYDNGLFLLADSAASYRRLVALSNVGTPYVESASFLKVRELTLSYDLPSRWLGGTHGFVNSARVSVSAHNLFASFRYSGLDPEVSNFGNTAITRGQDVTPYPPARSFFLSVDLGM
jgi:outer membrane receptor protein involved in Fe transport